MMKKNDLLSMLVTFVVGLFAGSYLYTTGFADTVAKYTTPDVESVSEFSVASYVYGGCRNACPSFRVENDGSYRLFYTPVAGAEQVLRQGTLPFTLQRQLNNTLIVSDLVVQSQPREPALCNSFADGIDIRYEITVEDTQYELNSCGTTVDGEGKIWKVLDDVWNHLENS